MAQVSRAASRTAVGHAFCSVSPARCAVSSLTCAKRMAQCIATGLVCEQACFFGCANTVTGSGGLGASRSEVKEEAAQRAGDTNVVKYPVHLNLAR